jgi:N-hydroxyarylamine O-acetyltransferase
MTPGEPTRAVGASRCAARALIGRMLILTTRGGTRTEQQLDTDDALLAAYRDHFGIELSRLPDDPAA